MKTSYAVSWKESDGNVATGMLDLLPLGFRLRPSDDRIAVAEIHYEDLAAIRIGRGPDDELEGKPALVLERRSAPPIRVASVAELGLASELAHRMAAVALGSETVPRRLLVIVPLKEGQASAARRLLGSGPPFAPAEAGLERHEAYLTAEEAVFVFESLAGDAVLRELLSSAAVWEAAPAWRELIAGPPRIAEAVYSWQQSRLGVDDEAGAAAL